MQIQTIYSKHISKPETGYPVSFTQRSLFEIASLGLDDVAVAYENIPRSHFQGAEWLGEEQRVVRPLAETPEKALEVAKDHCGRFGCDFRLMPLKETASLLNASDHKFTGDDILSVARLEGKSVRSLGEIGRRRFELWEVESVEGTFVSGGGAIRYLSTLSPRQTIAELERIERAMIEANLTRELDEAPQQTLNTLLRIDREARRHERAAQIEAGFTKRGDSYLLNDGKVEGFFATITPRDGVFDVEVLKDECGYVVDDDMGAFYGKEGSVERSEDVQLSARELTIDNVRTSLRKYGITLPPGLAKELSDWREEYWQGHADETNKIAEVLKGVLTDVIYNDMSAMDAEERGIGATELAGRALASAGLAGIEASPKTRVMVQVT